MPCVVKFWCVPVAFLPRAVLFFFCAQARKLWELLEKKHAHGDFSHTFGALDPVQVRALYSSVACRWHLSPGIYAAAPYYGCANRGALISCQMRRSGHCAPSESLM